MRISSRRLLWGFNCLLLLTVASIYRPIRSWIDQTIIASAIHPNLKVQEIHFHWSGVEAGLSVVEAKQFDWSATQGNRSFGISAERAWMVVENESLVDKVVTIPKALLQQSKLYLESIPEDRAIAANTTSIDSVHSGSLWQQQLNSRFSELEWNDLRQHFDGVLKLNSFANHCDAQVEGWVKNTAKIASDAQLLSTDSDHLENPLRGDAEIQSRLTKLDQLIAQDKALRSNIAELDSAVQAKLEEIDTQFDVHIGMVKEKAQQIRKDSKQQVAQELLEQAGGRILSQFKAYPEIADLLCRASIRKNGFGTDEDYRTPGRDVFNLSNLMATGVFVADDSRSPFRMQTECMLTTKEPFGRIARASFRYQFDVRPFTVKLVASSRLEQPEIVDLQIEIEPLEQPAVDLSLQMQPDVHIGAAQWIIGSNGQSIAGELCIDRSLLPFLAEGNPAMTTALARHLATADKQGQTLADIVLEIGGTWDSPTWKINCTELPQWLEATIDAQLEQQIRDNEQQLVARLEKHVAAEIDRLGNKLEHRLDIAQQQTERYSQSLVSAHATLKNKLPKTDGNTEFARSVQEEVKR
jgi:hypothetical protein